MDDNCAECEGTGIENDTQQQRDEFLRGDATKLFVMIRDEPGSTEAEVYRRYGRFMTGSRMQEALTVLIEYGYVHIETLPLGRKFYLSAGAPNTDQLFTSGHVMLMDMRRATVAKMLAGEEPYKKVTPEGFAEFRNVAMHLVTSGNVAAHLKVGDSEGS